MTAATTPDGKTTTARATTTAARAYPPLRRLTVLYDPQCKLCTFVSNWLPRQRQLVPLDLVPADSPEARRRFPALDHAATLRDVTVIGDAGQIFRGDSAWIVCLWALADHRAFSHTLSGPAGRRLARAAVLSAAKYRGSGRHTVPAPAAGRSAEAPGRGTPRAGAGAYPQVAPGWTYDKVTGWTQAPDPDCTDGCAPRPG